MNKTKIVKSSKKLKSSSTMQFLFRELRTTLYNDGWSKIPDIIDHYRHNKTGLIVQRIHRNGHQTWYCGSGSGNANLAYWIRKGQ